MEGNVIDMIVISPDPWALPYWTKPVRTEGGKAGIGAKSDRRRKTYGTD